jgi:hypothetical protein
MNDGDDSKVYTTKKSAFGKMRFSEKRKKTLHKKVKLTRKLRNKDKNAKKHKKHNLERLLKNSH